MKFLPVVFLFWIFMLTSPAYAVDGHELHQWGQAWEENNAPDSRDAGSFAGYVLGFIDLHTDLSDSEIGIIKAPFFCPPRNTQTGQLLNAVAVYLDANPEKRRFTGSSLVASALWEAFPCD